MSETETAIIVVGRSKSAHEYAHEIADLLYDGYGIIAIHPLGEPGIDEQERFLAFVGKMGDEPRFPVETQVIRLTSSSRTATAFADFEDALAFAQAEYNLDEDRIEAHERFEKIQKRFPPPSAAEIEQYVVFQAVMNFVERPRKKFFTRHVT